MLMGANQFQSADKSKVANAPTVAMLKGAEKEEEEADHFLSHCFSDFHLFNMILLSLAPAPPHRPSLGTTPQDCMRLRFEWNLGLLTFFCDCFFDFIFFLAYASHSTICRILGPFASQSVSGQHATSQMSTDGY